MPENSESFTTIPYPRVRRLMVDGGRMGRQKHIIHGLLEIDVTRARQAIRDHRTRTGEMLSFTAFIISCLGQAVDTHKQMHAYRNWCDQLVIFDEVDLSTLFEVEVDGRKIIRPNIIRAVNNQMIA